MLIVTINEVPGKKIEALGVVRGSTVQSRTLGHAIMAGFRLRSASVPHERVQHVFHDACQLHDFPYPKIFRGTVVGIGIEKRHLEESAVFPQFIMNGKNHLF